MCKPQELLDNARNSDSGWNATRVHIWLDGDGTLNIQDNGRGMSYTEVSMHVPACSPMVLLNEYLNGHDDAPTRHPLSSHW